METMQPTLKRGRDVWDRINMPKAEFLGRVEKIRGKMQQRGMDVLLVYANSGNEYGSPCYISNYIMKMPQGAVVAVTRSGEVALICEGFARDLPGVKSITWVEDIRSCENAARKTVEYLKEKGLIPSTLGVAGLEQSMPYDQFQFFSESIEGCKVVPADDVFSEMRQIKSQKEVDQLRRASRLVGRIFKSLSRLSFSRINEKRLEAVMSREAYIEGAEDVRTLIANPGEKNWALRPFEDLSLSAGHPVILYLAVEFERYWAEGIRTFVFRENTLIEPPDSGPIQLIAKQVIEGLKPGKQISRFYTETIDRIRAAHLERIPEYGLGQGIGLSLQETPILNEEESAPLREGMCFALRCGIRDKELGAILIGETVHLSGTGPEVLTRGLI